MIFSQMIGQYSTQLLVVHSIFRGRKVSVLPSSNTYMKDGTTKVRFLLVYF